MARPHALEQREVGQVVADMRHVPGFDAAMCAELRQYRGLVFNAAVVVRNAELPHAAIDRRRGAPADDSDGDAGGQQTLHRAAVQGIERLHLLVVRAVVQPAVGEHAVHVENQQPHAADSRTRFLRFDSRYVW